MQFWKGESEVFMDSDWGCSFDQVRGSFYVYRYNFDQVGGSLMDEHAVLTGLGEV